jgi:hypothetical protein
MIYTVLYAATLILNICCTLPIQFCCECRAPFLKSLQLPNSDVISDEILTMRSLEFQSLTAVAILLNLSVRLVPTWR